MVILYEVHHAFRFIPTDGRPHPDDIEPSYLGDSIGRWDGDTLVVDVVGFNTNTWLVGVGTFHSEKLRVTERYTRDTYDTIIYEVTMEDPEVLTKPWKQYAQPKGCDRASASVRTECIENNEDIQRFEKLLQTEFKRVAHFLQLAQRSVVPGYSSLTSCSVRIAHDRVACNAVWRVFYGYDSCHSPPASTSSNFAYHTRMDDFGLGSNDHQGEYMMGGTQLGFGTPTINPAQSIGLRNTVGPRLYGRNRHRSSSSCSRCSSSCSSIGIEQQQLQQLVPQRIQLIQQIQYLIHLVAQQQTFLPQGGIPFSAFGGPAGWLAGSQGVQPQVFGGQAGYVM